MHWLHAYYKLSDSHFVLSPGRRCSQQERHIPVTRLSASLLTSWLFPDKYSRPLDSPPLSSRIIANYQEAVCWKDAARNYICLQTRFRSKHMLWKKKYLQNQNCLQSITWLLRNACTHGENENWVYFILIISYILFFFPKNVV